MCKSVNIKGNSYWYNARKSFTFLHNLLTFHADVVNIIPLYRASSNRFLGSQAIERCCTHTLEFRRCIRDIGI